eukprot:809154-Amphidinium_carterae.1
MCLSLVLGAQRLHHSRSKHACKECHCKLSCAFWQQLAVQQAAALLPISAMRQTHTTLRKFGIAI